PGLYDQQLSLLFGRNGVSLLGESAFTDQSESGGGFSSDMGDVCHIMPALQAFAAGWEGTAHTSAYLVSDDEVAYILPAKVMAMTVIDLLWGEAATAADIVRTNTPVMTKDEYLAFMRSMNSESLFPSG
ncbi:MAG: amidohydrolase, partial [Chloroflexota bacterium]